MPKIQHITAKKLVGIKIATSLADDKTSLLWKRFMNLKDAIQNEVNTDLFSVQVYGENFISGDFDTNSVFEKWAAIEVNNFDFIPKGLQKLIIPEGDYAVFTHKGTAQQFAETSKFIFEDWLPNSDYQLEARPHFEVLGKDYKGPEDPKSEEKIWIPVKKK
ncbi:GyrI-like domain-containing protein [Christiangramia fulva]|nr:GyrI-like domain-containing protein [Christiangramia fulva]